MAIELASVRDEGDSSPVRMRDTSAQDTVLDGVSRARRRRWWAAGTVVALLIVATLLVPAVQRWAGTEMAVPRERLRFAVIERGPFVRDVAVQGTVVAAVSPTLYSPEVGTVNFLVRAGERVTQGQVLAEITSPERENALSQEQATLESLEIELSRLRIESKRQNLRNQQAAELARVALVAAEREMRRAEASWDKGVISRQDYEKAGDDVATSKVEHRHAIQNAELEQESLAFEIQTRELERDRQALLVEELQRRVSGLQVRSPVDGVVGNLAVNQNSAVGQNSPILTVVDLTALEAEVQVPQNYADDLAAGMRAEISFGGDTHRGELVNVSPEVQDNYVRGRVRFDGTPPGGLRQNQRLSVRIVLESVDDTLTVARGPFLESGGGRIAYVVDGDLATRRVIRTGGSSVGRVEILDGVAAGETVVISSYSQFDSAETILLTD